MGLISENLFAPIIVMVIVTTLITPILLKIAFKKRDTEVAEA
jgi:Kef-type K+ transport system membrane component KefB